MVSLSLQNNPRGRSLLISLLVLAILLPVWWLCGNWYRNRLMADRRIRIENLLSVQANFLSIAINQRITILKGLRAFAEAHLLSGMKMDPAEFTAFASVLCGNTSGIRHAAIAPEGIMLFVYPPKSNETLIGHDLINDRRTPIRSDVQRAIRSQRIVLSGPYTLHQKGLELVARQAIYSGETFWGLVSSAYDLLPIFAEVLPEANPNGLELTILDRAGNLLYGKKAVLESNPVWGTVDLPDGPWKIAAVPLGGWNTLISKSLLQFRGVAIAILLMMTVLFYLTLSYRSRLKLAVKERTGDLQRSLTNRREEEENLNRTLLNLRRAMGGTLEALAHAVEAKDPYTSGHQRRVADLARTIATEMGLPDEELDGIRMAAVLHDIGNISLPAEILSKPTLLSEVEFNLIKTHPQKGYDILKEIDFPWPVARTVWQHHERLDGSGYPLCLKGDEILPGARILAVADVVEAMASDRSYRSAPGLEMAMEEIQAKRGDLYDPIVVDACLRIFKEKDFRLA
jgi:putative nucleotidyltransferase with HDIG domain